MTQETPGGYAGRMLRLELSGGQFSDAVFDEATLRKWVGGNGIGAKVLYDEVPPEVTWDDPENRLIIATGPLAGTSVMGTGTFSAVTVGAMTGGATTTQANGFMGAYMKFAGFDGVILQGRARSGSISTCMTAWPSCGMPSICWGWTPRRCRRHRRGAGQEGARSASSG